MVALSVRTGTNESEIVKLAPTGPQNVDATPPTIAAPPTLAIGDVHCVLVIFQVLTPANTVVTPAGMTLNKPATDAAQRQMVLFTRPIKTAADLTAAQSTILRAGSTSTRVVALSFAVVGADLDSPVLEVGAWRVTSTGATVNNYIQPIVTDAYVLFGTYSNNAATSTHPVHTSPWGTMLAQAMALSDTGETPADTVLSLAKGGTNTTFSVATANSGSFGVAFRPAPIAYTGPVVHLNVNGVKRKGHLKYMSKDGVKRTIASAFGPGANPTAPEPTDPEPIAMASEGLPFNASPIQSAFAVPNKVVVAHDFPPYPIWIGDTASDYYANNYLTEQGEGGIHAEEGGMLRDRPMIEPRVGATRAERDKNDHKRDIERATAAGIDAFVVDIIGTTADTYIANRIQARHEMGTGPWTLVAPMLDCNGAHAKAGPTTAAAKIAAFYGKAGTWLLPDGRMVVGAFKMEGVDTPPQFWVDLTTILRGTYGINPAYIGSMNTFNATTVNQYKDAFTAAGMPEVFYAVGLWGLPADPLLVTNASNQAKIAHDAGLLHFGGVSGFNERPGTGATSATPPAGVASSTPHGVYDEAANTAALRAQFDKSVAEGTEIVQLVTWNDYSEGGEYQPSTGKGFAKLDLTTDLIYRFKMGQAPVYLEDNLILSHRSNFASVDTPAEVSSTTQTAFMWQWVRGGTRTTPQDTVEALTFLRAPAQVEVRVGPNAYTYNAPAGMFSQKYPLALGEVSARILRGGSEIIGVVSPVKVVQKPVVDDKKYFMFSAIRGTEGQFDATPNRVVTMPAPATSTPATATPASVLNIGSKPGQNHFLIQVAVVGDTTQSRSVGEIERGYNRTPEFQTLLGSDGIQRAGFYTAVRAPIMDNSSWPRVELREVDEAGVRTAFNAKDANLHWMHGRTRITHLPPVKPENVVMQLHNGARDAVAIRTLLVNGRPRLVWRLYSTVVYVAQDPYVIGTEFRWMVRVQNGIVRMFHNNMTTPVWTGTSSSLVATSGVNTWYFKAGNYVQSTTAQETDDMEWGSSELRDLRHFHTGWANPAAGDPLGT